MDKDMQVFGLIVSLVFLSLVTFWFGVGMGEKWETRRIYNACLETNASMIHSDAVAKCKEIIK
jgi:hypothetical protein